MTELKTKCWNCESVYIGFEAKNKAIFYEMIGNEIVSCRCGIDREDCSTLVLARQNIESKRRDDELQEQIIQLNKRLDSI